MLLAGDDDGSRNIVDSGGGCRGGNMGYDVLLMVVVMVLMVVVMVVVVVVCVCGVCVGDG